MLPSTKMAKLFPRNQESNMKSMTIVRYKKSKMKFEIICYKYQVPQTKTDLEEPVIVNDIIQIPIVYTSVAKGQIAKPKDLQNVFKTKDNADIILQILKKGEIVKTATERRDCISQRFKDLASRVHQTCVHSGSKNQFDADFIVDVLHHIDYKVIYNKSKLQQLDDMISHLQRILPLERRPVH